LRDGAAMSSANLAMFVDSVALSHVQRAICAKLRENGKELTDMPR